MNPFFAEWVEATFMPGTPELGGEGRRTVVVGRVPQGLTMTAREVDYLIDFLERASREEEK